MIAVRLTPKADRDEVDGVGVLADGRAVARVRVRALPADGEANAALIGVIARAFGRPKSAVAIVAGAGQRLKQVRVRGDPADLGATAERWDAK